MELAFPGDGEMALRMRGYPWPGSPLGHPRDWPASLRTACRICLTSRFPMIVWWGEELRFFYNDAYLPLLGNKHPALVRPGEQVWSEIWDTIGPMLDSVMRSGRATWSEDLLLPMNRHGYWEETYWTYSYSPLHDDDGAVRGVFTAVQDTTEQVVGRRRLAVLQDLGAQAGHARSVAEACELVVQALGPGPGGRAVRGSLPAGPRRHGRRSGGQQPAGYRSVPAAAAVPAAVAVPAGGYEDDVALVLYHQPGPLDIVFNAESGQLAPVRAQLRSWLNSCGIGPRTITDALIAAGEACANAIEHGHRHLPGRDIRLRAVSTADQLRLTVTDTGRWKPEQPGEGGHRGRGIALMRALIQQVTIEPGPAGTTVEMYARITP